MCGGTTRVLQAWRLKPRDLTARLMVQHSDLLKFDQARDKTSFSHYSERPSLKLIPNSLEHQSRTGKYGMKQNHMQCLSLFGFLMCPSPNGVTKQDLLSMNPVYLRTLAVQ